MSNPKLWVGVAIWHTLSESFIYFIIIIKNQLLFAVVVQFLFNWNFCSCFAVTVLRKRKNEQKRKQKQNEHVPQNKMYLWSSFFSYIWGNIIDPYWFFSISVLKCSLSQCVLKYTANDVWAPENARSLIQTLFLYKCRQFLLQMIFICFMSWL